MEKWIIAGRTVFFDEDDGMTYWLDLPRPVKHEHALYRLWVWIRRALTWPWRAKYLTNKQPSRANNEDCAPST